MSNQWMNYHHLYYFKTIAEEGSVSKAAQKLRLGQPTLSAQLKQFEDHLGIKLFERQHKKLILTEQGKIAFDYAKSIFKLGGEMVEVLHDKIRPSKINLHIGVLDSVSKQITMKLAQAAYTLGPCYLTLSEGRPDEMIRELVSHRLDLFLTNFIPVGPEAKNLYSKQLVRHSVSIYGAPQFKHLRKNFPHSLQGQPFILPTYDSKVRFDLEHWCNIEKIRIDIVAETQDMALKKMMAIEGIGLIAASPHFVTKAVEHRYLMEIGKLDTVFEELFLVAAQRKVENPLAAKLIKNFSIS